MVSAYITYRNNPSLGLAQGLAKQLTEKRIQVYLAPEDKSGNYRDQFPIIEQADVFICVVAEGTFEPRWVQGSVQHAAGLSKPMVPVYQDDYMQDTPHLPDYIQALLAQDGFKLASMRTDDSAEIIDSLVKKIYGLVGKVPGAKVLIPNQYIFLSYSRRDSDIMKRIHHDLEQSNQVVWVDEEGLEPGTPAWERAIGDALRQCGCLVAILSPDAEQSVWVGRELAMAEALKKRIFPILVRGTEQDAIPFRLMTHQWVDARQNYGDALSKLNASISKHFNVV